MKLLLGLPLLAAGLYFAQSSHETYIVYLTGNQKGLLTPCGCSSPMLGGLPRLANLVKRVPSKTLLFDGGGWVTGTGRQDELKVETFAQSFAAMNATAVFESPSERALGEGSTIALKNLLGSSLVGEPGAFVEKGPFLIGGGSSLDEARQLAQEAVKRDLQAVFLLGGDVALAREIARANPALFLIEYRSNGHAERSWEGGTLLATPGDEGKQVVRLSFRNGKVTSFMPIDLGPEFADDPEVSAIHDNYLSRVADERLIDRVFRSKTPDYAGSEACFSCHRRSFQVWQGSAHAHALKTLEEKHEGADPDCVRCHVTGLNSTSGYRDRAKTPHLAFVSCESCHGPSKAHAQLPKKARTPAKARQACVLCHTPEQSPRFEFASYWKRIEH